MPRRRLRVPDALWSQLGDVRVVVVTPCIHPDGEHVDGYFDHGQRVLYVDGALSVTMQVQRALHEVVHLWFADAEIDLKRREERVVQCVANGIWNLLYGAVSTRRRPDPPAVTRPDTDL